MERESKVGGSEKGGEQEGGGGERVRIKIHLQVRRRDSLSQEQNEGPWFESETPGDGCKGWLRKEHRLQQPVGGVFWKRRVWYVKITEAGRLRMA